MTIRNVYTVVDERLDLTEVEDDEYWEDILETSITFYDRKADENYWGEMSYRRYSNHSIFERVDGEEDEDDEVDEEDVGKFRYFKG